ncbi:MAG: hypothetical protein U0002_07855 [Thermoanaerobaculia bacterium]
MSEEGTSPPAGAEPAEPDLEQLAHPKGTLAIVLLYAALFAAGWLAFYFLVFLPRGAPHP